MLVKLVYYFGAAAIVLGAVGVLLMAIFSCLAAIFGGGFVQLIAVPAVAAVGLVYWRFLCELFMLAFLATSASAKCAILCASPPAKRRRMSQTKITRRSDHHKPRRELRGTRLMRRVCASSITQFDLICADGFSAPAL